jgi:hypothetical protein
LASSFLLGDFMAVAAADVSVVKPPPDSYSTFWNVRDAPARGQVLQETPVYYQQNEATGCPFADGPSAAVLPSMPYDNKLALAVAFVKSAMKGRKINFQNHDKSMFWMAVYYNRWYRNFITLVAMCHMSLALIEPASNLNSAPVTSQQVVIETRPIEAFILLAYVADIAIKIRFMGIWEYLRSWNKLEFLCTLCFALDVVAPVKMVGGLQFSRILRPFFIVTKRKHIRFIFTGICYSIPRMIPVLVLLVFGIVAFALTASMILTPATPAFAQIATNYTAAPPYCSAFSRGACDNFYGDFSQSFYTLFVLVARANWPLSMLPFYSRSEWAGIFFAVFLLVAHFFLWRLLLAVSFASFAEHCRAQYSGSSGAVELLFVRHLSCFPLTATWTPQHSACSQERSAHKSPP